MNTLVAVHPDWAPQLDSGLAAMALTLGATQREALLGYLGLLAKWNRAYNLTAVRDPAVMVPRQLLDSLSILPWVDAGPVLDVGTGAGLPGIPLAIARPRLNFSLLDSNAKKTRFVRQVVGELGLTNVEVIRGRAERLARPAHYARITSRAFASLVDMLAATETLLAPQGCWLAMKGTDPQGELAALPAGISGEVTALHVPGEAAARHLVVLRRAADQAQT
jgi:16S rRNA (guanine527-N7)-methyltransferase